MSSLQSEILAISNINTIISNDIQKVWNIVLAVDKYNSWRSDLSKTEDRKSTRLSGRDAFDNLLLPADFHRTKTEIINDKQFIEYHY